MTPEWIEELVKYEADEEVCNYVTDILTDLTTPEKSRLESPTERFDCLEDYCINRILFNNTKCEDDKVYYWLVVSKDFFALNEAYELCFNIQRAMDIIKSITTEKSETIDTDQSSIDQSIADLPF